MPRGEFLHEFGGGEWAPPEDRGTQNVTITPEDVANMTGKPKEQGGWNAGDVEWMIKNGLLDPETATRGLVEKDLRARRARGEAGFGMPMRSWANPYGQVGPQTWEQAAQQAYQYNNPYRFTPMQPNWSTALRNFDIPDVTWASFPEQKRGPSMDWLRASGYNQGGSLGRYGMRSWTTQGSGLTPGSFESIPDESLKKWMKAMFGLGEAPM